MALTQADKNEIINALKAESQGVDELPVVSSLDGIVSLPAIRGTDVVSAPVSLLRKPAEDAARTATTAASNANTAASQANSARDSAAQAAAVADAAAKTANTAADDAVAAAAEARAVVDAYEEVAVTARDGATARFSRFVTFNVTTEASSSLIAGGEVVFLTSKNVFAYIVGGKYYLSWSGYADV